LKVDDRSRRTVSTDFLTVRELAALLRVKPRKVYGLAASCEIPCSRATGKLLFPRDGIEAWLARHGATPAASSDHPKRPPIIVGSHDPLLDWALRESGSGIASFLDGSLDGLDRLRRGEAIAAGLHLIETEADGWNRRHVQDAIGDQPVVLLEWAWRDRGLLVGEGNPLSINSIQALRGHRFIPRQPGAGSQVLLERLLQEHGLSAADLVLVTPIARSEAEVAASVLDDKADAGFGLECLARQFHLDFVPIARERYDLAMWRRSYFEPAFQRLLALWRSPEFARRASEFGGYDITTTGTVHFNGP
jgi:putative molybdopterin biosynthesis protein